MMALFEFRNKIEELYSKYDTYIVSIWKFLIALLSFLFINGKMGYFSKLDNVFLVIILALFCSFLPVNGIVMFSTVLILGHLYGLSIPALVVGGGILVIVLMLYFGTAAQEGYVLVLTMLALTLGMPCVIPLVFGLISGPFSLVPICLATVLYYTLVVVTGGSAAANAMENGTAAEESQAMVGQIRTMLEQILKEEKLVLTFVAMIAVFLVVYLIRRMMAQYAWTMAIALGSVTFFVVDILGSLILGRLDGLLWLFIGTLLSVAIAFAVKFMIYQVDYSKSMNVEFEDDDYVYYVKAVPKLKKGREENAECEQLL